MGNHGNLKKNWEQLQTMEKQTYTNIIYGNEPIEAFDTFVKNGRRRAGIRSPKR